MKWNCSFHVMLTKALISCAVIVQLICAFVFTYAKCSLRDCYMRLHLIFRVDQVEQRINTMAFIENLYSCNNPRQEKIV